VDDRAKRLIVVGDRVLIAPEEGEERTRVGLYLPQTAIDAVAVQGGKVVATGPGTPMPDPATLDEEPWKLRPRDGARYVPMQAQEGDYALFFRKAAVEITFENTKYLVVPLAAILTPTPDLVTQCLLALPMLGLYMASIGISWVVTRGKR